MLHSCSGGSVVVAPGKGQMGNVGYEPGGVRLWESIGADGRSVPLK